MNRGLSRKCLPLVAGTMLLMLAVAMGAWAAGASPPQSAPTTQPLTSETTATNPSTHPAYGQDVVMLNELVSKYEPVPFAHRRHAQMAEMWNGCTTCHHNPPQTQPATMPAERLAPTSHVRQPSQSDASVIPACKSCHPVGADAPGIHMPSLKGAYHRQCLNCHRDWMDSNACLVCHAARKTGAAAATTAPAPTPDDIVGRMHQPIPEPKTKKFVARFTPVAGPNVLFRHDEHVKEFGIKCVTCHHRDSCSDCHAAPSTTAESRPASLASPLHPGRTWDETHGPCVSCHRQDRCSHCHYQNDQSPPPQFNHRSTGQSLDTDHEKLACAQCHLQWKVAPAQSCGVSSCHKRTVAFPADRPGLYTPSQRPTTAPATAPSTQPLAQPTTRPVIIRIRRGAL